MYFVRGVVVITLIAIWTVIVFTPLFIGALISYLLPRGLRSWLHGKLDVWLYLWTGFNRLLFDKLGVTEIQLSWSAIEEMSPDNWYLVICNHQSWTDILILQTILWRTVPPVKFFTKQELIWIPFIGLGMFALGFPYVKRATRAQIKKKPELRNADRENVAKACERFKAHPATVLNFLEGTRYTAEKHAKQNGRFERLLNPKVGGISYVFSNMHSHLHRVLDITIAYPEGTPQFWDFLQGKCPTVDVQVEVLPMPSLNLEDDKESRRQLSAWVEDRWQMKDKRLDEVAPIAG